MTRSGTATTARPTGSIALVATNRLELHPRNPRKDPGDVTDLANSIRAHGILEPLVVVPDGTMPISGYLVVAGGRRLAAAKVAKLSEVPVLIREDLDERGAAAASLVENLQREDLDPIQEAEAYRDLIALTGWQQKELAAQLGVDATTVSHALRLLEAPKVVQDAARKGTIGAEHARVALGVPAAIASKLELTKGVTVEELREQAQELKAEHAAREAAKDRLAKARAEHERPESGKVVTWGGELYAGRERVKLTDVLGPAPKRIAGILEEGEAYVDVGGRGEYLKGGPAIHDKVCECRAWAILPTNRYGGADGTGTRTGRVCITPAGWAAYVTAARKATRKSRRATGGGTSKAERERQKAREQKQVVKAVDEALEEGRGALAGVKVIKAAERDGALRKLTKGGVGGEPLRLVVFALAHQGLRYSDSDGAGQLLWAKVAKLPRRELEARAVQLAAAHSLSVFGRNAEAIQQGILEHYKIVAPAAADENGEDE